MEKAIKLLSLVDEYDFLEIYLVISKPAMDIRNLESIAFLTREEAQEQCDYLNKKYNTDIYRIYSTCMQIH